MKQQQQNLTQSLSMSSGVRRLLCHLLDPQIQKCCPVFFVCLFAPTKMFLRRVSSLWEVCGVKTGTAVMSSPSLQIRSTSYCICIATIGWSPVLPSSSTFVTGLRWKSLSWSRSMWYFFPVVIPSLGLYWVWHSFSTRLAPGPQNGRWWGIATYWGWVLILCGA